MSDVFLHVPAGDHNPYVPVPWARVPLAPFADEPFRVGAKTDVPFDSVAAEWESGSAGGTTRLEQEGEAWVGEIGPVAAACRYRFVGRATDAEPAHSQWYELEVPVWAPVRFTSIGEVADGLLVGADAAALRLDLRSRSLAWSLASSTHPTAGSGTGTLGDWHFTIEAGGRLGASRGDLRLELWTELAAAGTDTRAWRLHWALEAGERLLGTGERFDSLDQRGRRPDMRVYEQYKGQGSRTYFPVPWLISTRGYGLAVDGAERNVFDLGASLADTATLTAPGEAVSGQWYVGSPAELLRDYTADLGTRKTIPMWAYGPWMSANEWNSQARVEEVVERTFALDVPASVLVIEAWADEATFYLWNDTEYEPVDGAEPVPVEAMRHAGRWPDPKAMTDWLHEQGIRLVLWQIPVLKDMVSDDEMDSDHPQQTRDVAYADASGLVVRAGEAPYRNRGWWFPGSRVIDFSNPTAVEWWFRKRAHLLEWYGVDGFKTDGGEHLWGVDVAAFDGATGDAAANRFPTQYLAAYHRFLEAHGTGDKLIFSRAGFTGSQILPTHWAGDEDSTWEAYRASLTAGLSAGLCGVAFWGWDIAGFSGPLPTSELYQRATAMATFCPIMQYHAEHNGHRRPLADRTPWNVAEQTGDPDALETYRRFAQLRMNLVPYLYGLGDEAAETGLPLMRAMALAFPEDPTARGLDDQYMLGDALLVAPILEPGTSERRVYLPAGEWFDLWTGAAIAAGWQTVPAALDTIPVFVRGGAVVPLWMPADEIAFGARVGLPLDGPGRLVLLATPGEGDSIITEPTTGDRRVASVRRGPDGVSVTMDGAEDGTVVWLRDAGIDEWVALTDGSATVATG